MGLDDVKRLREMTMLGIGDCRKALEDAKGDFNKALDLLKQKGVEMLAKRGERKASQGLVETYLHHCGNLGAMVEVNCETDFVARTDNFKKFAKDIAMHIAAASPIYLKREDIPEVEAAKVPSLDEFAKQSCLMEQTFVKDGKMTIDAYLKQIVSQTGENVVIRRFARFALGLE